MFKWLMLVLLVISMGFGVVMVNQVNIKFEPNDVKIWSDKNEYKTGEEINIFVKNSSRVPIYYQNTGNLMWELENFKDGKWINLSAEYGGFQLTNDPVGKNCYLLFYEQVLPEKIEPLSQVYRTWNQKFCPRGTEPPTKPRQIRQIDKGKYRFVFNYSDKISNQVTYELAETKAIYSNEFLIK